MQPTPRDLPCPIQEPLATQGYLKCATDKLNVKFQINFN